MAALAAAACALLCTRACRPDPATGPGSPLSPAVGFAGWIAMLVAGGVGGAVGQSLAPAGPSLGHEAIVAAAAMGAEVLLALVLLRVASARGGRTLAHLMPLRASLWGVGALAAAWPLTQVAGWIVGEVQQSLGGPAPAEVGHETLKTIAAGGHWLELGLMLVTATIGAGFLEEFGYRGLLQQALRGLGASRTVAVAVTSLAFASMHWGALSEDAVAPGLSMLFVLSLLLGWVYERTGSLWAPALAHAGFNAANLLLLWLG